MRIPLFRTLLSVALASLLATSPAAIHHAAAENNLAASELVDSFLNPESSLDERRKAMFHLSRDERNARELPVELIAKALVDQNISIRLHGVFALRFKQPPSARCLELLSQALRDKNAIVRHNALDSVSALGKAAKPLESDIRGCLLNPDYLVQVTATETLAGLPELSPDTIIALTRKLESPHASIRGAAAQALRRAGRRSASSSQALVSAATLGDDPCIISIQQALLATVATTAPVLPAFKKLLAWPSQPYHRLALESLTGSDMRVPQQLHSLLFHFLETGSTEDRRLSLLALKNASNNHTQVMDSVLRFLDNNPSILVDYVREALFELASREQGALSRFAQSKRFVQLTDNRYEFLRQHRDALKKAGVALIEFTVEEHPGKRGESIIIAASGKHQNSRRFTLPIALGASAGYLTVHAETSVADSVRVTVRELGAVFQLYSQGEIPYPQLTSRPKPVSAWRTQRPLPGRTYRIDLNPNVGIGYGSKLKSNQYFALHTVAIRVQGFKAGKLIFERILHYEIPQSC